MSNNIPHIHAISGHGYSGADTISLGPLSIDDMSIKTGHKFPGTDIRITPANGGYIISISKTDSFRLTAVDPDLYVVGEDQDLGNEINKIITMHYLKK